LHVVFFIDQLGLGGAQRQLFELARGLDKSKSRVTVVTIYPGGVMESEFLGLRDVGLVCLNRKWKYDFLVIAKAALLLRKLKAEVVQTFLPVASVLGLSAAILAGTPVKIATKRTGGPKKTSFGDGLYRSVETWLAKKADASVANSEAGKQFLIGRGVPAANTRVILNGVSLERLSTNGHGSHGEEKQLVRRQPGNPTVGIVASLTPEKDHDTFLRAAARIHQAMPTTTFAILGDGPLRSSLEALRAELGLNNAVTFWGYRDDVASFYESFDVVVLATVQPEGHSNTLLEAMALGKPVVATDTGGTSEIVSHGTTGLLVPRRDPDALAKAICKLLTDQQEAARLGSTGQAMVLSRFGVQRMVKEYDSLYRELYARTGAEKRVHEGPGNVHKSPAADLTAKAVDKNG